MTSETMPVPKGWEMKRLGDILQIQNGYAFKSTEFIKENAQKNYVPLIRQSQLVGNTVDLSDCVYLDKKYLLEKKNYIVNKGDILIGMSGSIGKVSFYENDYPALLNQRVGKLNVYNHNTFQKYFFAYLLLSLEQDIIQMAKGMGVQNISSKDIEQLEIPVPPLTTQQAIVNKIETLFAEIDAGIGHLKTAEQQLKQYRQALLKNAFNGELTKQWRAEHAESLPSAAELLEQIQTAREQHYAQQLADWQSAVKTWEENGKQGKKPSKPKMPTQAVQFEEAFAELPNGWLQTQFGNTTEVFVGSTPSRKNNEYWNGDIFWVSSGEVKFSNIFETKEKITTLGLNNSSTTIHPIGTVMLAMIGEGKTRGQAGILKVEACHNQNTAALRVNKEYLLSEYLYYFFMFNYEQTRRVGSGNNQKALNKSVIENMFFPICSLAEQAQIVAILESKLTACDQLANEITAQLKQAELLKQAVLKAAFSGKLLEQSQ
ncbi:restriction endonuclease subunit S [Gallibacterium anatis]|uniref:restriction endonuclease subunit S n=1 Tax=Gallibacterium anatis TaxID=750 RepID=UPI0039FC6CDE